MPDELHGVAHLRDALVAAREVDDNRLRPEDRHTLLLLASYWPNIEPGVTRLARELGVSRTAAYERLKRLRELGYLETRQRGNGQTPQRYLDLSSRPAAPDPCTPAPAVPLRRTPDRRSTGQPSRWTERQPSRCTGPKGKEKTKKERGTTHAVVAELRRTRRAVDPEAVQEALDLHARSPEHALHVAQRLAQDVTTGALRPSRSMAEVYATRLRSTH
jgi:DNA-binding transcriptional ArsR family regulator